MFGARIGWIAKTFDYINRVTKRFCFRSMRVRGQHSPLSLLCITMILRVRRIFLEITMFPNTHEGGGRTWPPWHALLPRGYWGT